jgi:hypothetical protein
VVAGGPPSNQRLLDIATTFRNPRKTGEMRAIAGNPSPSLSHQRFSFVEALEPEQNFERICGRQHGTGQELTRTIPM